MIIVNLYRYQRIDGGYTVSPNRPDGKPYTERYRIIADDGKAITDGQTITTCADVESTTGWTDTDLPDEEKYRQEE